MTEKCRPIGGKEKGNERGKKIEHEIAISGKFHDQKFTDMSVRDIGKTQFCAQFLTSVFCVFISIGLFQVEVQWRWRLSNIIQAPGPALSSEISRKCYIRQVEKLFIFFPKFSLYWLWDIFFSWG